MGTGEYLQIRLLIYSDLNRKPIDIIGHKYPNQILLKRTKYHFDLIQLIKAEEVSDENLLNLLEEDLLHAENSTDKCGFSDPLG